MVMIIVLLVAFLLVFNRSLTAKNKKIDTLLFWWTIQQSLRYVNRHNYDKIDQWIDGINGTIGRFIDRSRSILISQMDIISVKKDEMMTIDDWSIYQSKWSMNRNETCSGHQLINSSGGTRSWTPANHFLLCSYL